MIYTVTYDIAKPRVITLQETLHSRSLTNRKWNQQDRRDDEFREVSTSSNIRNIAKYLVFGMRNRRETEADGT
jgi:hypothetical protein